MAFYDAVKRYLKTDQAKERGVALAQFPTAVLDLTRADKREASPPTFELSSEAKRYAFQLLGHELSHPEY